MPTSSVPVLIEVTEEFSATIYRVRGKWQTSNITQYFTCNGVERGSD
jgi:hypothetical protein